MNRWEYFLDKKEPCTFQSTGFQVTFFNQNIYSIYYATGKKKFHFAFNYFTAYFYCSSN